MTPPTVCVWKKNIAIYLTVDSALLIFCIMYQLSFIMWNMRSHIIINQLKIRVQPLSVYCSGFMAQTTGRGNTRLWFDPNFTATELSHTMLVPLFIFTMARLTNSCTWSKIGIHFVMFFYTTPKALMVMLMGEQRLNQNTMFTEMGLSLCGTHTFHKKDISVIHYYKTLTLSSHKHKQHTLMQETC